MENVTCYCGNEQFPLILIEYLPELRAFSLAKLPM